MATKWFVLLCEWVVTAEDGNLHASTGEKPNKLR